MKQFLGVFIVLLFAMPSFAQDVANGEKLFKSNCASCHKPDRKLIGPALQGVREKYNDDDYLVSFIQNSQAVIGSGDERAVKIYEEYNKQIMTAFAALNTEQVLDILAYVDSFEKADPSAATGIKIRPVTKTPQPGFQPMYLRNNFLNWAMYLIGVLMLIGFLYQMVNMSGYKEKLIREIEANKRNQNNSDIDV